MANNKVLVEFQIVQKGKNFSIIQKEQEKHNKTLDKTDKKTKNLNKTQGQNYNRQKQGVIQTANSTKNFSKLSQTVGGDGGGPGGLVRAYALLAANVFALTAAFGVLSRSAQIDTLNQSMEVLSTTGGVYIKNLAKDMQEASGFAIDLAQSFRQVSLAASAGLNTSEIEGLTKVAKGAAISLGRNLPDAMDRIFRGAIKLEPEILDEIGLFVRVDEAAQKYARNNGKVVSALTQVEKRQAFLNEILEQGTKKFAQYAEEIKPDPYVRLGAALGDIAQGGISVLNSVLGPVLNMLAESKILLGAVFGTLVLTLLKKAIPAMGLFTQSQAEQANSAAQNAREYTQGLRENTDTAFKENKKRVTDEEKTQRKLNRARKPLALKVGGKDASSKLEADLQNKKIKGAMRLEKVEQRILDLTKKQGLESRKKMAGYDEELSSLREEIRLEKELNRITQEGVLAVKKGGLADRRQQKLDRKAGGSSIIAMGTGVGETAGMREGWKSLTKGIGAGFDTLDEKGEKVTKQFTRFQGAALKAQGGASLLAGGISRLMMIMGPFMMVAALLAPLVMMIGKAMGFGREEVKAYGESLTRLSDQIENIDKRFKTQTEQLRRGNLTYIESVKATLAFNKGQKETATNILEVSKAFDEVRRTAGFWTTLGDNFLGKIVWGDSVDGVQWMTNSKFKQTVATLEGGLKNLVGAARGDNDVLTKIYTDQIAGAESLVVVVKTLAAAEDVQFQKKEAYYKLVKEGDKESLRVQKEVEKFAENPKKPLMLGKSAAQLSFRKNLTEAAREYLSAIVNTIKAEEDAEESKKSLGATSEDYTAIAKEVIELTDKEIKILERLASAATGASESIGKFQAAFMPKTKVDDVLSSFKQFESAFADIQEKADGGEINSKLASGFFAQFADADNAFGTLFKSLFHEVDGVMVLLDASGDTAAAVFKDVAEVLNNFRNGILTTKVEIQSLKAQQKLLNTLTMGGIEVNTLRQKKFTEELKKTAEMQRQLTSVAFVSFGLGVEEAGELAEKLAKEVDTANKRNVLQEAFIAKKINANQLSQAQAYIEQEEMKRVDYLIAVEQESLLIKQEGLKAQQKINNAQKEFSNAKRVELELEAKLTSLKTRGTAALSPQAQADLDIDAAIRKRDLVIEESKIKLLLLDVEEKLLLARIDVLEREGKLVGINVKLLKENVQRATGLSKSALRTTIGNASSILVAELAASTSTAFGGGLVNGAVAGTKALKAGLADIEKRRKESNIKLLTAPLTDPADALNAVGKNNEGFKTEEATLRQTQAMTLLRDSVEGTVAALNKLGPDGVAAGAFLQGSMNIMDSAVMMGTEMGKLEDSAAGSLEGMAMQAQFAATAISNIGSIMAANSQRHIAELDKQITAEKNRDGKSEQSVAKMKALEAKKEGIARKAFNTQKKVQMASVALNTAAAIMQVMAAPGDPYKLFGIPMTYVIGALGAAQLAMIASTSYGGGASNVDAGGVKATALNIGGRNNSVDTTKRASSGELSYIRGEKGSGSNANNFRGGAATGIRNYAAGGLMVGEQGPERIDIVPNEDIGKATGTTNINFSISAIDGASVQSMLQDQQGNIISMIQAAANETGEEFLPQVDPSVYGTGG